MCSATGRSSAVAGPHPLAGGAGLSGAARRPRHVPSLPTRCARRGHSAARDASRGNTLQPALSPPPLVAPAELPGPPGNTTAPVISGSAIEGQALKATDRYMDRKPDLLCLPVGGLQQLRRRMQQDLQRPLGLLHAAGERCRLDDRRPGDGRQLARLCSGSLGADGCREHAGPPQACKHVAADDLRLGRRRPEPQSSSGDVDGKPDLLRLPVAGLQQLRLRLRLDLGRDRLRLHPPRERCRTHGACSRDGRQLGRLESGRIGSDRGREHARSPRALEHLCADDQRIHPRRPDAYGRSWHLDRKPDLLRLPVGALQLGRRLLQRTQRRRLNHLRAWHRRRRRQPFACW